MYISAVFSFTVSCSHWEYREEPGHSVFWYSLHIFCSNRQVVQVFRFLRSMMVEDWAEKSQQRECHMTQRSSCFRHLLYFQDANRLRHNASFVHLFGSWFWKIDHCSSVCVHIRMQCGSSYCTARICPGFVGLFMAWKRDNLLGKKNGGQACSRWKKVLVGLN